MKHPVRRPRALGPLGAAIIALCSLAPGGTARAGDLPEWARAILSTPTPASASRSEAVVLYQAGWIEYTGGDRYVERRRTVIRILTNNGRSMAVSRVWYWTDGGNVRSLRGWAVSPTGQSRELSDQAVVDAAYEGYDLYNEIRSRTLSGESEVVPGGTFVSEWTLEARDAFAQAWWPFQGALPVVRSEFSLRPPPGWGITANGFNTATPQAQEADGWKTWSLSDLAPIEDAPDAPTFESRAPSLGVSLIPPAGAPPSPLTSFATWRDVSRWIAEAGSASAHATPSIEQATRSVVGAAMGPSEKIRAIARFCQSLNYVAVQMGLSRGGGYVPHPADRVLAKRYGDCKDKANLMCVMLRCAGIPAYPCVLSADDPDFVRDSWPTPGQFNHCIVAVRSDDSAACVISTPELGRLVLFDPTHPTTTWGDLPETEQGGWALVVASGGGDLMRVPVHEPDRTTLERRVDVAVSPNGLAVGRATVVARNSVAATWRLEDLSTTSRGLIDAPSAWLGLGATAATIDSFSREEGATDESTAIRAAFRLEGLGRPAAGRLVFVDPGKFSTVDLPMAPDPRRTAPLLVPRLSESDEVSIVPPAGFALEDTPAPVDLESSWGTFRSRVRVEDRRVILERTIRLHRTVVPLAESAGAYTFLGQVRRALDAPLVLTRP